MQLKDKIAIVTGSTKGIGNGFAHALAAEGAKLVVVSRSQADCEKTAAELSELYGVETLACATDLTDFAKIDTLVAKTVERFGRIDILVNNAGSAITKRAEEISEADWDRVLNIDLKAVFFCAQAVGKVMIGQNGGKIINIASIFGQVGDRQVLPYCVAKGGVIQMSKCLALEWARYNIQVNTMCPGYVITAMNEADLNQEKIAAHIMRKVPMRRYGQVDDMKAACVFLASGGSDYMTGQTLTIDGGWTCE